MRARSGIPQRIHATYGAVADRDLDGKHYRVLEAHARRTAIR